MYDEGVYIQEPSQGITNKDFKCYNLKTINLDMSVFDNLEMINK